MPRTCRASVVSKATKSRSTRARTAAGKKLSAVKRCRPRSNCALTTTACIRNCRSGISLFSRVRPYTPRASSKPSASSGKTRRFASTTVKSCRATDSTARPGKSARGCFSACAPERRTPPNYAIASGTAKRCSSTARPRTTESFSSAAAKTGYFCAKRARAIQASSVFPFRAKGDSPSKTLISSARSRPMKR